MSITHEQNNDERDLLLIGGGDATGEPRSNKQQQLQANDHREGINREAGKLTRWLSNLLMKNQTRPTSGSSSSSSRKHLTEMSNWLYHPSNPIHMRNGQQQQQRSDEVQADHEATYDILDDEHANTSTVGDSTVEFSPEDGFERVAASAGRKSPNYPFHQFYQHVGGAGSGGHRRYRQCRLLFLISCLLVLFGLFVVLLFQLVALIQEQRPKISPRTGDAAQEEIGLSDRWLVSSPKCHIPAIDPWHESIKNYVRRQRPINCRRIFRDSVNATGLTSSLPLTYTKDNRLQFTQAALELGYPGQRCCFTPIQRRYEDDNQLDPDEKCYLISQNKLIIYYDLIKVYCLERQMRIMGAIAVNQTVFVKLVTLLEQQQQQENERGESGHSIMYTNVHSFIVRNPEEEQALDRVAARKLNSEEYYNVVMVGVDTISRLNGYRQLNKTLTMLKEHYETLEFVGYNKVGENTFPNLIPFLTGLTPEQLTKIQCWLASNYSQETERGDDYMDNCKYLWNFYQDFGYITYFSEDWPKASTFNYLKEGFRREPTTFYGRPFTLARDELLLPPVGMGCSACLLDRPLVEIDLDNLKNFVTINQNRPHFAFHWVNCPQHDDLNGASTTDAIFKRFFEQLKSITHDDRTFVIFFSDHGYRWNDFVSTRVGHYESSLPLLTIAPPKLFIQKHPDLYENLKRHQTALLTPFDMFKTLVAIRDLAALKEEKDTKINNSAAPRVARQTTLNPLAVEDPQFTLVPTAATTIKQLVLLDGRTFKQSFRTVSLLDSHNSTQLDRSCITAGIPDNYCVCHAFEETQTSSSDVLGAAYYLVYVHLYARLKDHQNQCYLLDLEQIHKAELFDFKQMKSNSRQTSRRRRDVNTTTTSETAATTTTTTTTPSPATKSTGVSGGDEIIDVQRYLPSREYNIRLSTKPGGGLFQEVVRYYGHEDMKDCEAAVERAKSTIEASAPGKEFEQKHESVVKMNQVCRFSVHSDSISRLNLYKDQSKCVKSNIELKKICYCTDLPT